MALQSHRPSLVLEGLTDISTLSHTPELITRLDVLLTDYLTCIIGSLSSGHDSRNVLAEDGVIGRSAWLAQTANGNDQDDIDWTVGVHPGSIVWSVALALAQKHAGHRDNFLAATLAGYRTFATVATVLGASHRAKWHITATAGAFASATTAAVLLGYSPDEHLRALHLAGANIGGSILAPRDRSGAGGFNRASATGLGLTATLGVRSGAQNVVDLWEGPSGVLELYEGAGKFSADANLADGVSTTSLRLFPVTGFAQAAVLAAANLAKRTTGELRRLDLGVSGGAILFLDGTRGGEWWDARSAVARAWSSQDPTNLVQSDDFLKILNTVHLSSIEIPIGGACVIATTDAGEEREVITSAPGRNFSDPLETLWRKAKWDRLAGDQLDIAREVSMNLVMGDISAEVWNKAGKILQS